MNYEYILAEILAYCIYRRKREREGIYSVADPDVDPNKNLRDPNE